MQLSERTLLRLHVEAVWGVQLPAILQSDIALSRESKQPPWRLCAAAITGDHVNIWRPDVPTVERDALLARAHEALALPPTIAGARDISREVALQQVASPTMDMTTVQQLARPLTSRDRALLRAFQPNSEGYYLHVDRRPLIGVISEGRLLSLAHSSRRTSEACELGITTLPEARRRGYALAATVLWAVSVSLEGLIPIYSALIKNQASLSLASAAGYRIFAHIATIK
ncbi:MAG TPA: hypothetical protein DCK85_14760 [Ktedonobacter sp.]|nr:hypothetical protein [Ktedonobacter sp.]HBE28074.1 hypothetical protein [Ktedonobacter sp.]